MASHQTDNDQFEESFRLRVKLKSVGSFVLFNMGIFGAYSSALLPCAARVSFLGISVTVSFGYKDVM